MAMGDRPKISEKRAMKAERLKRLAPTVREAAQMGFTRCILPARNLPDDTDPGLRLIGVATLVEALERLAEGD